MPLHSGNQISLDITGSVSYTHLDVYKRQVEGFCVRGFEKDQIPGRHLRAVLADGVVDAVLFDIAFQTTDAGLADLLSLIHI